MRRMERAGSQGAVDLRSEMSQDNKGLLFAS